MNESLLFSIRWQKSCSTHHLQIRLRTPKERVVFSDCFRIWNPQSFSHQPNKVLCHPSHPTDFFATQILGGHVTSRNQGLSSNDQGRQRRETLGTRLGLKTHSYHQRTVICQNLFIQQKAVYNGGILAYIKYENAIQIWKTIKIEYKRLTQDYKKKKKDKKWNCALTSQ